MKNNRENRKNICVEISLPTFNFLKLLKDKKLYPSKSEMVRIALRDFFIKEIILLESLHETKIAKELKKISDFEKEMNKRVIGIA